MPWGYEALLELAADFSFLLALRFQDSQGRKRFIAGMMLILVLVAGFLWILRPQPSPLKRAIQAELKGDDNLALATLRSVQESDRDFVEAMLRGAWLLYQADDKNDEAKKFLAKLLAAKLPAAKRTRIDGMSSFSTIKRPML